MRTLILFSAGLLITAYGALATLDPARLPSSLQSDQPGLWSTYHDVYRRWDEALKEKRTDEALAWADEYLLAAGPNDPHRPDVLGMRKLALHKGAAGPEQASDRALSWRVERVLGRRSFLELAALGVGPLLLLTGLIGLLRAARRPPTPPWEGPRPGIRT